MYIFTHSKLAVYTFNHSLLLFQTRQAGINGTINTRCATTLFSCSALPKLYLPYHHEELL